MGTALTDRQQEILNACLRVIEHEGLKGFTMRNIAQQIGFTDAALYRHFPDKRAMVEAIARLFQTDTLTSLEAICSSCDSAVDKLRVFLLGRAEQFESNRAMTSVLFSDELFRGDGVALSLNNDTLETHARLLQSIVVKGQAEGSIRRDLPPGDLVLLLTGPMKQMVLAWKNDPSWALGTPPPSLFDRVSRFWATYETLIRA